MHRAMKLALGVCVTTLIALAPSVIAQAKATGAQGPPARPRFTKAIVIDERLSALRLADDIHAPVRQRLRVGRTVYVTGVKRGQSDFYRVAVTRRTRGWIHQGALALPGRAGEDGRVLGVIEETHDGLDRIALCRLFVERFARSRHAPRALLLMGEEAGRAAASLTQRARRRLKQVDGRGAGATAEDFYLSDPGLDRYSRLHVAFHFDPAQTRYTYDGRAYRDLVRRYPQSREAETARLRLEKIDSSLAKE